MVKVHVSFQMSLLKKDLWWSFRIPIFMPTTVSKLIFLGTGCTAQTGHTIFKVTTPHNGGIDLSDNLFILWTNECTSSTSNHLHHIEMDRHFRSTSTRWEEREERRRERERGRKRKRDRKTAILREGGRVTGWEREREEKERERASGNYACIYMSDKNAFICH